MRAKLTAAPYLVWMGIFIVAPLVFVFYYAFTDSAGHFTFANIAGLKAYLPTFLDSIMLGAIAAIICLLIAYPFAYFISRTKPRTQRIIVLLVMLPMCMSFLLRTLAWVSLFEDTGIINNFLTSIGIGPFKLIRTRPAIVFGMVYNYLPYMILPLYTVLMKIDGRLLEASADLGANKFSTFRKVILPLSLPGIISGITMVFVPAVSTFYISVKMGPADTAMIGDIIEKQFKNAYNPNLGAAMSLVLMIMIFVCMAIMNRFADNDGEEIVL
ncbi:MAG: ABC transporter permease [Clostridia bacterium]|nr:ABC transporter permease [Clostridia bacterium]